MKRKQKRSQECFLIRKPGNFILPTPLYTPLISNSVIIIVISIPLLISPLIIRILDTIIKPIQFSLFAAKETSNPVGNIFDVVNGVVPFVVDLLRDVFYFLDFTTAC